MIHFDGPAFPGMDDRLMALETGPAGPD